MQRAVDAFGTLCVSGADYTFRVLLPRAKRRSVCNAFSKTLVLAGYLLRSVSLDETRSCKNVNVVCADALMNIRPSLVSQSFLCTFLSLLLKYLNCEKCHTGFIALDLNRFVTNKQTLWHERCFHMAKLLNGLNRKMVLQWLPYFLFGFWQWPAAALIFRRCLVHITYGAPASRTWWFRGFTQFLWRILV